MTKTGLQAAVRDANTRASSAMQKLGMILRAAKREKEQSASGDNLNNPNQNHGNLQ
jgi:hypothetical protein